jgi:hypothetical protein
MVDPAPLAVAQDRRRVIKIVVAVGEAHNQRHALPLRRRLGQRGERGEIILHEAGFQEQVLGRVAGNGEFRETDDLRACFVAFIGCLHNTGDVGVKRANARIDLR